MKQTQKGKKKGSNQKQTQNQDELSGFQFAMGEMDLIFTINFTDKDLEKPDGEGDDKYYKIEDMSSIKDLSFLKDKGEEFIGRIKMRPNNEFTKQLLLGNKISKKKCFIDFITYGRPKFEGDDEFFETIFNQVTLKNGFQVNSTPLDEGARFSLVIELKHKDKEQKIQLGTTPSEAEAQKKEEEEKKKEEEEEQRRQKEEQEKQEMEEKKQKKIEEYKKKREEEKKKEEGGTPEENQQEEQNQNNEEQNEEGKKEENNEEKKEEKNEEKNEEEEEEEDYEPNEAMKEKKIPKFKRQKSVLCNLKPSMTKYDLIYFNHEDLQKIPGDFKIKDLYELLEFFKKKKTNIFINFFGNESSDEEGNEKDSKEENKKEEVKKPEDEEKKKAEEEKKKKAEEEKKKKAEEEKKKEDERKQKEKRLNDIDKERTDLNNRKKDLNDNKKKDVKEMKDEDKKNELKEIDEKLNQLGEEEQDILDELRAEDEVKKEYKKKKDKEKKKEDEEKQGVICSSIGILFFMALAT